MAIGIRSIDCCLFFASRIKSFRRRLRPWRDRNGIWDPEPLFDPERRVFASPGSRSGRRWQHGLVGFPRWFCSRCAPVVAPGPSATGCSSPRAKLRVVVDRAYQLHEAAAHDLIKGYVALQKSLGLGWLHDRSGAISQHAGQSSAARAPFGRSSWRPTGFASPRAGPLRCRISKFGRRARFGGTGTGLDWGPFPSRQ